MTEDRAHLLQGLSQLRLYEFLASQPEELVPEAHALHFLQMATENIAKAVFLRSGNAGWDKYRHTAFSAIPHHLRVERIGTQLGWLDFAAFRRFLKEIMPLCGQIEQLHPQVGAGGIHRGSIELANVEYPWPSRDARGRMNWHVPADHHFGLLSSMRRPLGTQLIRFLYVLVERFEVIF